MTDDSEQNDNSEQSSASNVTRRHFMQTAGAAGVGVTVANLVPRLLRGAAESTSVASATGAPALQVAEGSRSLVCLLLAGGADSFNMVVPRDHNETDQDHATYAATRGVFAVPAGDLIPIGDGSFGMHPGLPGIAALANNNLMATVHNVGPLARPTSQSDYAAGRNLPQSLFAHDAQRKLWQTARPTLTSDSGWGGAIDDAASATGSPSAFSMSGSNAWETSVTGRYSRLSSSVAIQRLSGYNSSLRGWIPSFEGVERVLADAIGSAGSSVNVLERAMATTLQQSIQTTESLQAATADTTENDVGMDDIGGNRLGLQLRVVARLIKQREQLGMPRQVFFVRMGGWDTHRAQAQFFPVLLRELDRAVTSFHTALTDLGVADSVTTFTASDFGRTLTANGDGTDHGWGGNAFVFGAAVNGGRYGTVPSYSTTNNPDDIGGQGDFAGRLIPTTSVSQYGATFARWMGLDSGEINQAFPDIANFATRNLGFLAE